MTPNCHRHGWEIADATCSDCGLAFCGSCLFYVTRSAEAPMCVPCALAKAGVRRGREPRLSRKHKREVASARKREERVLADAAAVDAAAQAELAGMPDAWADGTEVLQPTWTSLDSSSWDIRPA